MEKLRSKIFACFLALALVLLTTPIGLSFDTQNKSIEIQSNKAHAVVPVAGAAAALLADMAAAAGLTVSEFVATVVGVSAVGLGMGIATDSGINYGNSAAVNLGNLIDAADYPAWDTLSDETKEAWGSKEYYDSAKFNSLLGAFGLGDARDRFYSSSGGSIDYTENELNRIQQLGRIGQNWINNGSNTVNDIISSLDSNSQMVFNQFFGSGKSKTFNTADLEGYDGSENVEFTVYKTSYIKYVADYGSYKYYYQRASGHEVYAIVWTSNPNVVGVKWFSKDSFTYGSNNTRVTGDDVILPEVNTSNNAGSKNFEGKTYYTGATATGTQVSNIVSTNCVINSMTETTVDKVIPLLLFKENISLGEIPIDIVGYPEDIQSEGEEEIYYPALGVFPNMNWTEFTTAPEQPPDPGEEDLAEIIELLKRFHFTVDYNLLVQDNPLRSAVMEMVSALNRFSFYNVTGQLKVHDEGVYDNLGDIGGILRQIQATLSSFFVTDTASDVIGDFEFPELEDRALDLVDTISTLAPFGAMLMVSEVVSILSQVGKIQKPELSFDFGFMPGHTYPLVLDLSWMDQMKPLINIVCITTLILGLMGVTARLVELEAAA